MSKISWLDFATSDYNYQEETRNEDYSSFLRSLNGSSNENITEADALGIPAVQAIIEIIGGTIAQLPIYLYKEDSDGAVERIFEDPREFLLNNEPNPLEQSYVMKKNIVRDYLLHGSHRIYKEMKRNEVVALYSLPTEGTTIDKFYKGAFILDRYLINVSGENGMQTLKPEEVISILKDSKNGVEASGALVYGKKIFSMIKKELDCQSSIYENGAMPLGVLEASGRLTEATINRLRDSWRNLYSGSKNAAKTVILEEGLKYNPVSLNPKDLMLLEAKQDHISELCRLFNIPESLINSDANKYASLEQNNIAFLQYTLSPIITAIEDALNKSLLLEDEKEDGLFFAFDTSEVLKTTEKEKFEAIKMSLDSGVITINEARAKVNRKPVKDDVMKWSLGSVLYNPDTGNMMIPNMGIGIPGYEREDNKLANGSSNSELEVKKEEPKNNEKENKVEGEDK